jgi:hypothetical protein
MPKFSPERRRFTLAAAAAATTAVINPTDALAGISQAATPQPAGPGAPQTNPASSPALNQQAQAAFDKLSPSGKAEVEMKFASIVRKYGARLNDEQKTDIRRQLAEGQEGLDKMRAFALDNGDQPATVFQLYRNEGKK